MTAQIISGKTIAEQIIQNELLPRVRKLNKKSIQVKLVVFWVGENPASKSYIRQKEIFAQKAGILSEVKNFQKKITEKNLLSEIQKINQDPKVHGIIVQLPLPSHISPEKIILAIDPKKDVDGFSPVNLGKLLLGQPCLQSCTPKGIIKMLEHANVQIQGKKAVVIGRSNIVGKPIALLLLEKNATVTICHSKTKNLTEELKKADLVIVAMGKPEFIRGKDLKKGCTVIDVGIHKKQNGKLCGDVHFESASKVASNISPVPFGVGPMTVVSLIENTIQAAEIQSRKNFKV